MDDKPFDMGNTLIFQFNLPFKMSDCESQALMDKVFPVIQDGLVALLKQKGISPVDPKDIN